jgi:hypothetical protein
MLLLHAHRVQLCAPVYLLRDLKIRHSSCAAANPVLSRHLLYQACLAL